VGGDQDGNLPCDIALFIQWAIQGTKNNARGAGAVVSAQSAMLEEVAAENAKRNRSEDTFIGIKAKRDRSFALAVKRGAKKEKGSGLDPQGTRPRIGHCVRSQRNNRGEGESPSWAGA